VVFYGQNGIFVSTVGTIPEPSSLVLAGAAILLCCQARIPKQVRVKNAA
jgi:hypothetical protein